MFFDNTCKYEMLILSPSVLCDVESQINWETFSFKASDFICLN